MLVQSDAEAADLERRIAEIYSRHALYCWQKTTR